MTRKTVFPIAVFVVLIISIYCYDSNAIQLSDANIAAKLYVLKPLPKPHYSWKIEIGTLLDEKNDRLLYEYTRITHALSICGESVTVKQIDKCVYTCARVNKTKPTILCSIGINFSPWHRKFGKDLPPTDRGPTYYEEIAFFSERMVTIKKWIAKANEKYASDVKVGAVLLDCERFVEKPGDEAWNEGIREAIDAIHIKAKEIFPEARIEWYGRGVGQEGGKTWAKSVGFTGKEIKTTLSCSIYRVPEIEFMNEKFRKTCELADKLGIEEVTPYVALASGYRRGLRRVRYWDWNWDYDLIYSYQIGAELNHPWYAKHKEVYAAYDRAKIIVLGPPFYHESPNWGKHFVAYVRGATRVEELRDLGFDK